MTHEGNTPMDWFAEAEQKLRVRREKYEHARTFLGRAWAGIRLDRAIEERELALANAVFTYSDDYVVDEA